MSAVYINDNGNLVDVTGLFGGLTGTEVDARIDNKLKAYPNEHRVNDMIDEKIVDIKTGITVAHARKLIDEKFAEVEPLVDEKLANFDIPEFDDEAINEAIKKRCR